MAKRKVSRAKPARKRSTALVRASKKAPAVKRRRPSPSPPKSTAALSIPAELAGPLTEEPVMGALGLAELVLTEKEERVLAEPVDEQKIRLLPSGLVYYPHGEYRKWLNRAFGRLGWALRPISKPLRNEDTVGVYYVLFVHGKAVAQAFGAHEYKPANRQMSWDDAIEATDASALRRIMKRLGVSLELWDRQFNARFLAAHGVKVNVAESFRGKREVKKRWRLKSDPPLPGEIGPVDEKRERRQQQRDEVEASRGETVARPDEPIDNIMLDRLMTAITSSGRKVEDVKRALNVSKLGNILRRDYDRAMRAIQAPAPTLFEREPGAAG